METLIVSSPPRGSAVQSLPSLGAVRGGERVAVLRQLAGAAGPRAAREGGNYILEDKLALELKLQGLALPKSGEVAALSPSRWEEGVEDPGIPTGARGLVLDAPAAKRFRSFLRANAIRERNLGPLDLIHLARHFFYEDAIKVVVPTRNAV